MAMGGSTIEALLETVPSALLLGTAVLAAGWGGMRIGGLFGRPAGSAIGWAVGVVAAVSLIMNIDLERLVGHRISSAVETWKAMATGHWGEAAAPNQATEVARCDPAEVPRTMSTRWADSRSAVRGASVRLTNVGKSALFVKVSHPATGGLIETVLLLSGESITEPVFTEAVTVEVSRGSAWCNRLVGWKDATFVVRETIVDLSARRTEVKLGGAQPIEVRRFFERPPEAPAQTYREADAGRRLDWQKSESQKQSKPKWPLAARMPGQPPQAVPDLPPQLPQAERPRSETKITVRVQDWRHVPQRELRMVSAGGRHYVNGRVGGEDVQFEVDENGYTSIGSDLAQAVEASGCVNDWWRVLGTLRYGCRKLVRSLEFGTVMLENVLVFVDEADSQPVLGHDLIGPHRTRTRIYSGKDGWYISVGG